MDYDLGLDVMDDEDTLLELIEMIGLDGEDCVMVLTGEEGTRYTLH